MKVILASTSPYRKQLLARLGVFFEARAPEVDENKHKSADMSPKNLAEHCSLKTPFD